ncbi:MAG: hypothetical protein ACRDBQ_02435 [Shewanella sp.]
MKKFEELAFIGSGRFFLNNRRAGNVTSAKLAFAVDKKTMKNFQGGGGNLASNEKISEVSLALTLTNMIAENIALAMQSTMGVVIATTVSAEPVKAYTNGLAVTQHMIDTSQPVTVTTSADVAIAASNYEVRAAGIVLKDGFAHTDGDNIKVSYTIRPSSILQAAMAYGAELSVVLDGINDDNGKPHVLKVWRWKPAPTTGFDLIGEDYASFDLSGEILADTSKPIGKSQFFELHLANAA